MTYDDILPILDCEMDDYLEMPAPERAESIRSLASRLGKNWSPREDDERVIDPPSFGDLTGMTFVPGGTFEPGLCAREERILERWLESDETQDDSTALQMCIEELRENAANVGRVEVSPFLMSCAPIRRRRVELLQEDLPDLRLPTDVEWEWAIRAGSRTMFWWGDEPPPRIDAPHQLPNGGHPLALSEIGWFEEHCAGLLEPGDQPRFNRGGVEECCPWQGTGEFTLLLSSFRRPGSSDWHVTRPVLPVG